ncbi:extracellular solute-binding protein [Streptomyces sp. BH-SS-21]|uniref:Extracellular solute-binding protein n=1 Tax=Streptomyces liliiviolaceus TaxID=2823109 RepID=A0A941B9C9_9ACTN|nr:extracellular solute-binding protein [Streptomyces liliiviolaceus]MBQ0855535.1 extracellular solute-binding protein [Streptomyces liliiviolaceus]
MFKSSRRSRWIGALMAGACIAPMLTACGGGDSASGSGGNTIRFLGHTGLQASMDEVIKAFETAHPDIHVQTQYAPAGPTYGQTLITQIQGGNAPDVFYGNGGTGATESLIPLAKSGKLLDLSGQAWAADIPKAAEGMYKVDGKTYGLMMDESPQGILYKPAAFKSMGLSTPKTFSDVLALCKAARGKDKYGISLSGQSAGYAAEIVAASLVYSAEPQWNTKRNAGEVTFSGTSGWEETLERFRQMRKADCFQPGAESASTPQSFEPMTSGKALMTIVPSGALGAVAAGKPNDWAMVAFPGDTEAQTRVSVGYQDALGVSAATKKKTAALQFLDFVAGDGASTRAELSGTVSLAQAKAGDLPKTLQGFKQPYDKNLTIARPHDQWAGGGAMNALSTAVVAFMTGQSSAVDALKTVDKAWGQ